MSAFNMALLGITHLGMWSAGERSIPRPNGDRLGLFRVFRLLWGGSVETLETSIFKRNVRFNPALNSQAKYASFAASHRWLLFKKVLGLIQKNQIKPTLPRTITKMLRQAQEGERRISSSKFKRHSLRKGLHSENVKDL